MTFFTAEEKSILNFKWKHKIKAKAILRGKKQYWRYHNT
jgi:hypothetical protein